MKKVTSIPVKKQEPEYVPEPPSPPGKKLPLQMEWLNRRKVLVTQIRLKHSIAADMEINEVVPAMENDFWEQVNMGLAIEHLNPMKDIEAVRLRGQKAIDGWHRRYRRCSRRAQTTPEAEASQ